MVSLFSVWKEIRKCNQFFSNNTFLEKWNQGDFVMNIFWRKNISLYLHNFSKNSIWRKEYLFLHKKYLPGKFHGLITFSEKSIPTILEQIESEGKNCFLLFLFRRKSENVINFTLTTHSQRSWTKEILSWILSGRKIYYWTSTISVKL